MFTAHFAPHLEGGDSGSEHRSAQEPSSHSGDQAVQTVEEGGRSIEAVTSALASVPHDLARLIDGRSDDDLTQPAQDGGWGLVEILPHFADWEEINAHRVDLVLTEEAPGLEEHDDSLWAIEHGYRDQDPREAFQRFSERREALVERLGGLEPADWERVGILAKRGRVTLHWLLNSICNHDAKHVVQARDVLA
jgi:hypothetical protein